MFIASLLSKDRNKQKHLVLRLNVHRNIVVALTKVDVTTVLIATQQEELLDAVHVLFVNLDVIKNNHLLNLRSIFIFIV